jgi:NAD+ synthase
MVKTSRANGLLVGLSGGVDSSLVVKLGVLALDPSRVLGVLMPTAFTPKADIEDARALAERLGIQTKYVEIQTVSESFARALGVTETAQHLKIPLANVRARIRMTILYFFANELKYLVAGTGDRSEDLIGYFTKYGDGGVDFLPISHLYKTQVRRLALFLGIPERIALKPSSPQLYPGHKATDEIPADYDVLDRIEKMLFDDKLSTKEVASRANVNVALVEEVNRRYIESAHKRVYPGMARGFSNNQVSSLDACP